MYKNNIKDKATVGQLTQYDLKQRVLNLKDTLPTDYMDLVCEADPELNTPKGRRRIMNVKRLIIANLHITELLEKVAEKYLELQKSLKA